MTVNLSTLIVGGDSLVGGELIRECEAAGHDVVATTRRVPSGDRLILDLEANEPRIALSRRIDIAFMVAGYVSYGGCESDPRSVKINLQNIPLVGAQLLEAGTFVVFLSSNTVFGGDRAFCNEWEPVSPKIAYARQKADGEAALSAAATRLGASGRLCITRLTKIMSARTPPLPEWFARLRASQPISPFEDLIFAPMSVDFVARGLRAIGEAREAGIFHLSGKENISYAQFAEALVDVLGLPRTLVQSTTAEKAGVQIPFKPKFSGLGMADTERRLGLVPQQVESVVQYLAKAASNALAPELPATAVRGH